MTYPIHHQNQTFPAYSGVTINISNPTLNAAPMASSYPNCCHYTQPSFSVLQANPNFQPQAQAQAFSPMNQLNSQEYLQGQYPITTPNAPQPQMTQVEDIAPKNDKQAYPPQYYLNNYNYIQNAEKGNFQAPQPMKGFNETQDIAKDSIDSNYQVVPQEEDMSASNNIKNVLDSKLAEQKELEKNGTKTKVVALTNEYIMSLENYLNNPNTEIRLMASKEILTRLDEDKDRHDDAALNALLNKMLQDPEKLIRIAALSAFYSQLASGNDFTFELLTNIQKDPNADKEDVVQAADCLLKMSSKTETKFTPAEKQYVQPKVEEMQVEKQ